MRFLFENIGLSVRIISSHRIVLHCVLSNITYVAWYRAVLYYMLYFIFVILYYITHEILFFPLSHLIGHYVTLLYVESCHTMVLNTIARSIVCL